MTFVDSPPYTSIIDDEVKSIIYNFATLCSLLENKKLNFQNVLALVLSNEHYRSLLKEMLNENNDYVLVQSILKVCPEISTTKYITRIAKLYKK